jgi:hypothetical protein
LPSAVLALKPVAGELIWNAEMIERIEAGHTQVVDARTP